MPVGKNKPKENDQQENFLTTLNIETQADEPKHRKPKHVVWPQHQRWLNRLQNTPIVTVIKDGEPVVQGQQ